MKELTKNAINILGEKGSAWIESLPTTIKALSDQWALKNITPVENMSYNYVAKAIRSDSQPIILKIGFDRKAMLNEKQALSYFDGNAAVRILDNDVKYNALLLDQAIPGTTLKSFYPVHDEFVIDCYVDTVKRLLGKSMSNTCKFPHIKDWLEAIDKVQSNLIPHSLLQRAINLKNSLLTTMKKEVVLHGDLHHDNIIQNNGTWIVIDPKGIVGELEFEMAAFDFISADEIKNNKDIKNLFAKRLNFISEKAKLSAQRINDWVFVRLILSAAWHIEDMSDLGWVLLLAEKLM